VDYRKLYDAIVFKAKTRVNGEGYYENHHIIPKSLGGNDEPDNLVVFTAREHFICHWLLSKIGSSSSKFKMAAAFNMMCIGNDNRKINSHLFQYARENWSTQFKLNHHTKDPDWCAKHSDVMSEYYKVNPQPRIKIEYEDRICSCGCGGSFSTDIRRDQKFIHGHSIWNECTEAKRSASVKKTLNSLSKDELTERYHNSLGKCDHVERGKRISEGKKGKKSNQKEIMGTKFALMTDVEFSVYLDTKNYSSSMRTRFTGYRKLYVDK